MAKDLLQHPKLGRVVVTYRANSRRFIARRKFDRVELTAPCYAGLEDVVKALDELAPRIMAFGAGDRLRFHENQELTFEGLAVSVVRHPVERAGFWASQRKPHQACVMVGKSEDLASPESTRAISKALKRIASRNAAPLLLPRAKELATELKCRPNGWRISSGARILGQCNARGIISLSYMCVFLPRHLRDYIVCHELAHLIEMNHGPRFHELCDQYCRGREKQLVAELKAFAWPLVK